MSAAASIQISIRMFLFASVGRWKEQLYRENGSEHLETECLLCNLRIMQLKIMDKMLEIFASNLLLFQFNIGQYGHILLVVAYVRMLKKETQ